MDLSMEDIKRVIREYFLGHDMPDMKESSDEIEIFFPTIHYHYRGRDYPQVNKIQLLPTRIVEEDISQFGKPIYKKSKKSAEYVLIYNQQYLFRNAIDEAATLRGLLKACFPLKATGVSGSSDTDVRIAALEAQILALTTRVQTLERKTSHLGSQLPATQELLDRLILAI